MHSISTLLRSRRSVFPDQFAAGERVDDALINEALENATWAPNHGQTEPWRFVVFTDAGLQTLAIKQAEDYKGRSGENFKEAVYQKFLANPLKASHIVAIIMKRSEKKNIPEIEDIEAVSCAVQNLALSIHAMGLGGYWTTGGLTYSNGGREYFNLGEEDKLLGFFYLGKIAVPSASGKRAPLEEKVQWINS